MMLALAGFMGCGATSAIPTMVQMTTPITFDQSSASVTAANGLSLTLSIGSTSYKPGEQVSVNIDEKNTLAQDNNVPVAALWPIQGLTDSPIGTLNFPFGIAVLEGYYTADTIASATPLVLYDPNVVYFGPMVLAGITSYDFRPSSNVAAVYTKYNAEPMDITMATGITAAGFWGNGSKVISDFAPGVYTVVGGNEWGALLILHFTVA